MRSLLLVLLAGAAVASAGPALMVVDSGGSSGVDRVMLFSHVDGSLIDTDFISEINAAGQWTMTTPKEAVLVGSEIWVSEQVEDKILRFNAATQQYISSITTLPSGANLDNVRGMGFDGSTVYVVNGTSTAVNRGIARYNTSGAPLGFWQTPGSDSMFDAEPWRGELLVSNSTDDTVDRFTLGGAPLGTFSALDFPQQVVVLPDDSVISVASIGTTTTEGLWHWNADGSLRRYINTTSAISGVPRGAYPLVDGGYLIASSNGIFKATNNGGSWTVTLVFADASGQYITFIPEPASLMLLGLAAMLIRRR